MIYYGTRISENISIRKPEGYLICKDVPIARIGSQKYLASQLGLDGDTSRMIIVERPESEVFDPACIASFEGMPFVNDHPDKGVNTDNIAYLQKGHVQNIRRGSGIHINELVGDIIVTDPYTIQQIQNGKREISCGYDFMLDDSDNTYTQRQIRGNHVALVDQGRAGHSVCINDSKPNRKDAKKMAKNRNSIISRMFASFAKDADVTPEDIAEAADELQAMAEEKTEAPVVDRKACDEDEVKPVVTEESKLDKVLALLEKLVEKNVATDEDVPEDKLAKFTQDLENVKAALEEKNATPVTDEGEEEDAMASLDELENELVDEEPESPAEFEKVEVDPETLNKAEDEDEVSLENVPDEDTYPELETEDEDGSEFIEADDEDEEEVDEKAAVMAAKATADSAMRMAIKAVKPYIASLPKAQRKQAADSVVKSLRKQMGKDAVARKNDYTALIKAKRKASDNAVKTSPRDLGKRIMASRNVNCKK